MEKPASPRPRIVRPRRPRAPKRKDVYDNVNRFEDIDADRTTEALFDPIDGDES